MISDLQVATADDGKRLIMYPLELSLRDYFAAAALTGMRAAHDESGYAEAAVYAYRQADAMLVERAK